MVAVQLRLFHEEKTETEELSDNLDLITEKMDNLRKGLFKRQSTMSAEIKSQQAQIDFLQAQLYVLEQYIKNQMGSLIEREMSVGA